MKCTICNTELKNRRCLSLHLATTHKDCFKSDLEKEEALISMLYAKEAIATTITDYVNEKYPITALPIDIVKYITLKGLKRTASQEKKTKRYLDKYVNSMQTRYGVDNPSQLDAVKKKKVETLTRNHGSYEEAMGKQVMLMNDGYKEYLLDDNKVSAARAKIDNTVLLKYGVCNVSQIPYVRKLNSTKSKEYMAKLSFTEKQTLTLPARKAIVSRGGGLSKPELKVRDCLDLLGIDYLPNQFLFGFNYDMQLQNNILIEVNGDMWHANPLFYEAEDLIMNKLKASDLWDKDARKKKVAEDNTYKVIYIWEHETKTTNELLCKLINKRINNA